MWNTSFSSCRNIVDAQHLTFIIDTVNTISCPHTRSDFFGAALFQFIDQMRVSNMRPRHAHQINQLFLDGISRGCKVRDACRMDGWRFQLSLKRPRQL